MQHSLFAKFVVTHHVETLLKQFLMPSLFLDANFHISIVSHVALASFHIAKQWTTASQKVRKSLHTSENLYACKTG